MFRSMGWSEEELSKTEPIVREFLATSSGRGVDCYLAMEDDRVVGGCAVSVQRMLPSYKNRTGMQAYLHNMYVEPDYRGRGIATALLEYILDTYRKKGISRFALHASEMGRPLYERMSFEKSDNYYVKSFQDD
jgi:GNAT superfamily N-acetyltransferase